MESHLLSIAVDAGLCQLISRHGVQTQQVMSYRQRRRTRIDLLALSEGMHEG